MLSLSFCYKNATDCKSILFKEETGLYNVDSNPTGWGLPNSELTDIVKAELIITKPDDSQITIDISSKFPTVNTELIWQITAEDLGYSETIDSGLYTLMYKLTTNITTYIHTSKTFLYSCKLHCQIQNILADSVKFQMNCDNCNSGINENILKALQIDTMYNGLCAMSACGTSTIKIKNALENLETLVSEYDVEDCNCS
jgi:CRISPR/Cas system CMR-associated protein Cmr1 (group 7 of RAMP superfamily)